LLVVERSKRVSRVRGLRDFQVRMALHLHPKGLQRLEGATALPPLELGGVLRQGNSRTEIVRRPPCSGLCTPETAVEVVH